MSRVYLAREELPDRDVAIKVFDEELSARLGRERFIREVDVTSQLGHPHIVPIHAAGDADGALYYVMPAPNVSSWSARILEQRGRFNDAFQEARRAVDLDPVNAGRRNALASVAFRMRGYDVVIEQVRTALRLAPTLEMPYQGRALALTGRWEECLSLEFEAYQLVRALCLDVAGREQEGRELAEAAETTLLSGRSGSPGYLPELLAEDLTVYYSFVGNAAKATEWLRFAFELSPAAVDTRILDSELMDRVRTDPDFAAAQEEVWEKARARVTAEQTMLGTGSQP
jgi:tetratricopeptide (TPR) repeat protein